jgi:hypothetical protein
LQKTITELQQHLAELQENNVYNDNLNQDKREDIISTNDILKLCQKNENETRKVEPSAKTLIFDTKDFF